MSIEKGPELLSLEAKELENGNDELDPWVLYLYSIKSPATKEKYLLRLGKFLGYIGFHGALEDIARELLLRREKLIVIGHLAVLSGL